MTGADQSKAVQLTTLALRKLSEGRQRDGEALLIAALKIDSRYAPALLALANLRDQAGDWPGARTLLEQLPGNAAALETVGIGYFRHGDVAAAADRLQRAWSIDPSRAGTAFNLGVVSAASGNLALAGTAYRAALALDPAHPESLINLGELLGRGGGAAEVQLRRALSLTPTRPEPMITLAAVLHQVGRNVEAEPLLRAALAVRPDDVAAANNLASVLVAVDRIDEAGAVVAGLLETGVRSVPLLLNVAAIARRLGDPARVETAMAQAIALAPNDVGLRLKLAEERRLNQDPTGAVQALAAALALTPGAAAAWFGLAALRAAHGEADRALPAYRHAIVLDPQDARRWSNYLMAMHYAENVPRTAFQPAHRAWGAVHAASRLPRPALRDPDPDRPLRIGFLSGDFRHHATGYFFLEPLRRRRSTDWSAFLYANAAKPDDWTASFQAASDGFHDVSRLDDAAAAALIEADRIDILVEMSGHTLGGRLPLLAHRPAPLIASWLDYTDTTGVADVDYEIGDTTQTTADDQKWWDEELITLPVVHVCYTPPVTAPAVAEGPERSNGHVTFGCFNTAMKVSVEAVQTWAEILHVVPSARLFLAAPEYGITAVRRRYVAQFGALGIAQDRLTFAAGAPHAEFMARYREIDIALDPMPYSGGLNTAEALWMGVPVITAPTDRMCGRHAAAHLTAVGLTELIGHDRAEYAARAVALSQDRARLRQYRSTLRSRMANSRLCDADLFAAELGQVFRQMWRRACAGDFPVNRSRAPGPIS